ncbi:MAG: FkbM family methyltransferase [Candidatus Methylumidiphilus sp.]
MHLYRLLSFVWNHPLNAGGRIAAVLRVIRWQLASRLLPGPIALQYVEQTQLFATLGMTGATGNWYCGLHEVREMAFLLHVLREDDHFLDVGANIGSYTILAGGGVGARVTAVEPIPETFAHLERNVVLNRLSTQVRTCRLGLSDQTSVLRFTTGLDCVNHVIAEGENVPGIDVPVMRLDELVGQDVPLLVKIDVEGHERSVLLGGERTLSDTRLLAVIMETNGSGAHYGHSDEELMNIMRGHGFAPFGYDPFTRKLTGAQQTDGNTIFVRDWAAIEDRVAHARHYQLINGQI